MAANQIIDGATTITFDLLEGDPPPLAEAVERFEREGLDGYEALKIGKRCAAAQVLGIKWLSSESDAETHLVACYALQGQIVTVNNAWNRARTTVLIEDVRQAGLKADDAKAAVMQSGSDKVQVTVIFTMRRTA